MAQILLPRQKRSQLEALSQALSIANVGFGIASASDKRDLLDAQLKTEEETRPFKIEQARQAQQIRNQQIAAGERAAKQAEDLEQGVVTPLQLQSIAKGRQILPGQEGAPGTFKTTQGRFVTFSPLTAAQESTVALAKVKAKSDSANQALAKVEKTLKIAQLRRQPVETLVKERNSSGLTKDTQKIAGSFRRVLATEDTAAGDISLIFNFMKMLDPGSVVRESEFATAQNAAGVPDRVKNIYNRALKGQRLTDVQKRNMISQSQSIFVNQLEQQKQFDDGVIEAGSKRGIETTVDIFPKLKIPPDVIEAAFARFGGSVSPPEQRFSTFQKSIIEQAKEQGQDPLNFIDQLINQIGAK